MATDLVGGKPCSLPTSDLARSQVGWGGCPSSGLREPCLDKVAAPGAMTGSHASRGVLLRFAVSLQGPLL